MERRLSIQQARAQFSTLIQAAFYRGDQAVIERHGKPMAAIIPIHAYARWKRDRKRSLRESVKRKVRS